jgi:hypothetical protein
MQPARRVLLKGTPESKDQTSNTLNTQAARLELEFVPSRFGHGLMWESRLEAAYGGGAGCTRNTTENLHRVYFFPTL